LALTGTGLSGVLEKKSDMLPLVLIASGIFGCLVITHIMGLKDGEKRAVQHLEAIERRLGLDVTVQHKPSYVRPLEVALVGVLLAYIVGAIALLIQK